MKALVLCGGIPQIALMKYLKQKEITVVLADMNEYVVGRKFADIFYAVSVLDVEGIKNVAIKENVDFLITVCADQVLEVVAQVSELLGLPCYIDFKTAKNVSNKSFMKKVFQENGIPTSNHVIMEELEIEKIKHLNFPLIIKPVDSYSSKGVRKIVSSEELKEAFYEAKNISRTKTVIIEEFVTGDELTIDVYVENEKAKILCVSKLDKIDSVDKFVIHRTSYLANISEVVMNKIEDIAQKIADAFYLVDSPMLIQMIINETDVSVVEFCARTGGGDKFRLIEKVSGFDVVKAVADLTLGSKPYVEVNNKTQKYIINEFLYCNSGVFDHLEGFEELLNERIITEYFQLKSQGTQLEEIRSSGDRVAYFTIEAESVEDLHKKHQVANERIKVLDINGVDILRHDLVSNGIKEK